MKPAEARLPVSRLVELFELDEASGTITWKTRPVEHFASIASWKSWNIRFAGKRAGSVMGRGYRQVAINACLHKEHRVIFALHHGRWPEQVIDHINHVRNDNRPINLRDVSHAENSRNRKPKA